MNEKDGIIIKSSGKTTILAAATSADALLFGGAPLLTTAVSLSLSLYGAAAELRVNQAVDFVYFIKENLETFTADLVKTDEFQNTFVYTLEKYIRERNEKKREIIKRIFYGYAVSEDKSQFEIERMTNLLSLISYKGLELLKILKDVSNNTYNKNLSESLREYLIKDSNENLGKYTLPAGSNIREIWADAETDLISIGILRTYNIPRLGGTNYHDYDFTSTGLELIKYIEN